ncbi:MAG TPA: GNAT family N-acetyltransferase [Dehalococcoidia bacterium]|nr:GNAT family N-acetyltransferase [Dehalococcoidia bacterium]
MTRAERSAAALDHAEQYVIRALRDREQIRQILEGRRPYAAYALGQLEPALFRMTRWWLSASLQSQALLLHSTGGLGNATFAMGEAGALGALLSVHPGPRHTFLTCEVSHLETVLRHFSLDQRQTMIRMQATPQSFRPAVDASVRRLTSDDLREINRLYRTDGVPSFYSARQIDDAVYFGAERDGRLVAIAGTHVISSASAIAVVGNVYTHPQYRNQHLAQATTGAVTAQLLRFCREVVLSVDPTNASAVRAYERLGYAEVARLIEGAAIRRDYLGLPTAVRRLLARARGRDVSAEVVRADPG